MAQTLGPQFELVSSVARLFPRRTFGRLQDVSAAVPFDFPTASNVVHFASGRSLHSACPLCITSQNHGLLAKSLSIAAGRRGTVLYICQETHAVRHGKLPRPRPRLSVPIQRRPLRR